MNNAGKEALCTVLLGGQPLTQKHASWAAVLPALGTGLSGISGALKGGVGFTIDTAAKVLPIVLGVTLLTAPALAMGAAAIHSKATSPGEMDSEEIQKRVLAQQLEANLSNLRRRQLLSNPGELSAAGRVPGEPGRDREVRL